MGPPRLAHNVILRPLNWRLHLREPCTWAVTGHRSQNTVDIDATHKILWLSISQLKGYVDFSHRVSGPVNSGSFPSEVNPISSGVANYPCVLQALRVSHRHPAVLEDTIRFNAGQLALLSLYRHSNDVELCSSGANRKSPGMSYYQSPLHWTTLVERPKPYHQ
jgi:hypothetical protein